MHLSTLFHRALQNNRFDVAQILCVLFIDPASCDFEQECHMTIGKEANATVWWQVIPAYHEVDHTYQEYGRGNTSILTEGLYSPVLLDKPLGLDL